MSLGHAYLHVDPDAADKVLDEAGTLFAALGNNSKVAEVQGLRKRSRPALA